MIPVLFLAVLGMTVVSIQPSCASQYFTYPDPNLDLLQFIYSPIALLLSFMVDSASLYWLGIRQPLRLLCTSMICTWCGYAGVLVGFVTFGALTLGHWFCLMETTLSFVMSGLLFALFFALGKSAFSATQRIASQSTSNPVSLAKRFQIHLLNSAAVCGCFTIWLLNRQTDGYTLYCSQFPDGIWAGNLFFSSILATAAVLISSRGEAR